MNKKTRFGHSEAASFCISAEEIYALLCHTELNVKCNKLIVKSGKKFVAIDG